MEKQITIENLQAELASLTAERDALKGTIDGLKQDLEQMTYSKNLWYESSNKYEKQYRQLKDSMGGLRAVIDAIVNQ